MSSGKARHPLLPHALALAFFVAASVGLTWPLAAHLGDHVLGAAYYWDAFTNTMLMGSRVRYALGVGPGGIYENYFFAPIPDTIAFNENLFGLAALFAPFYVLSRSPLVAYNLTLLVSLAASGYFTFVLVRRLGGSDGAGLVAGLGFALSPYACFEIGRIQLVATPFIPLFFYALHEAIEKPRPRALWLLGAVYALQVGTCLYYAMFLLPLGALLAWMLLRRHGLPPARLWPHAAAVALGTAGALAFMVLPYFAMRRRFGLERSEDFAQGFDGKLSFFLHVHPTNRLWTALHHVPKSEDGAHEEIAFPTLTLAVLAFVALVPLLAASGRPLKDRLRAAGYALGCAALGLVASLLSHSLLAFALVASVGALLARRVLPEPTRPEARDPRLLWAALLLLSVVLFLGFEPLQFQGKAVRGLYYYLHTYVPGFNGIRKVSRQAVLTTFCCAVLAGLGLSSWLAQLSRPLARAIVTLIVLTLQVVELANKNELVEVPAGATVPEAYRFIAKQPGHRPIAIVPTSFGQQMWAGAKGLALHNYLALFHHRRMLDGKSSWIPPAIYLFQRTARYLPSEAAVRVIRILRPEFLVVHGSDLYPPFARRLLREFDHRREAFERVWQQGNDAVYRLRDDDHDPTLGLLETPVLDEHALVKLGGKQLRFSAAESSPEHPLAHAVDGDPETRWGLGRLQTEGDGFELELPEEREVVAVDLSDNQLPFDNPSAFVLEAAGDDGQWHAVFTRPHVRLYHAQVYRPKNFLFRVKLPAPARARKLRFRILEAMPDRWLSVYEAAVWVKR